MDPLPYRFRDPALLELALTHSSADATEDNERLEFLGDAALDLVVAEELYHHHSDLPEGLLTELKASVVSARSLAPAARALGIDGMARLGPGLQDRVLPRSVLANLFEAVLGAVYLDGGLEATRSFTRETLSEALHAVRERTQAGVPKQVFQEYSQREFGQPPTYEVIETRGEAHARAFLVQARTRERSFPSAWGRTRKEAESWAATEALIVLEDEGLLDGE